MSVSDRSSHGPRRDRATPRPNPDARLRGLRIAGSASIAILGALAYANTFSASFQFDDNVNIVHNPFLRWTEISVEGLWQTIYQGINDRPVADVSFALNYYLHGFEAKGFHAVNLLIHLANGLLVRAFARRTFERLAHLSPQRTGNVDPISMEWASLFAGLLFTLHPIQTESVTYIVQRMNSLATLFYLSCMLLYIRGRLAPPGAGRTLSFMLVVICGLLAVGSKENAATLPVAIWLYEWFFFRDLDRAWAQRTLLRIGVPFAAVGFGLYYIVVWGPDFGYADRSFGMGERLLTQARVVVLYVSLLLFPHPGRLNLQHDIALSHSLLDPPTTLLSGLALLAMLGAGIALAPRRRLLSFGILWFFLQLGMESTILPLEIIYEHRNYLPLVGVVTAVAYLPFAWQRLPRQWVIAATVAISLGFTHWTYERNRAWQTPVSLWSDVVAKSPGSSRAHTNIGASLGMENRDDEAFEHYRIAIELDPDNDGPHRNLGAIALERGENEIALERMLEAVRLDPESHHNLGGLGDAYQMLDRHQEAVSAYLDSVLDYPDERVFNSMAASLVSLERIEEAERFYRMAAATNPAYGAPLSNLGVLYLDRGLPEPALAYFLQALERRDSPETRAHIGNLYWARGWAAAAIEQLERAHSLAPDAAIPSNNLGWMLATAPVASLRDPLRAIELAQGVLDAHGAPEPGVLDTQAAALAALNRFDAAASTAREALAAAVAAQDFELAEEIESRLQRYQRGESYVETFGPP